MGMDMHSEGCGLLLYLRHSCSRAPGGLDLYPPVLVSWVLRLPLPIEENIL